jgi:argininosuccinate synthase
VSRVVLAYSGGLDTSVAIPYLAESGWEVVAVAVDVGQPANLTSALERAKAAGAAEARVVDARHRFVNGYVLRALAMNALYQARYPLVSALSRPLISEVLVDVARETAASAIAHGCTGKGNDQVRFETSLRALAPDLEVLAPVRDWNMTRDQSISYALSRGLDVPVTRSSPYSIDENLWGRSVECGALEDPWAPPPGDAFALTADPAAAAHAEEVIVGFEQGAPVLFNGESLLPASVIECVGKVAGACGFGRVDMIEDRLVGIKSREVYEAPAALALIQAHRDLESLTLERGVAREKQRLELRWAELVYEGLWFSPLREAIDAFCATTQRAVSGEVKLRFSAGGCMPVARRSRHSLYDHSLATYGDQDAFDQKDAAGFVRLWALPTSQWARVGSSSRG